MIATIVQSITTEEAIAHLATIFGEDNYRINNLRKELKQHEAAPILERFRDAYDQGWWTYGGDLTIRSTKSFGTRTEAKEWLDGLGFLNQEFSKHSYCNSDGSPMTECTLKAEGVFEEIPFTIEATYTRPGMSTANCKVVPHTSYSVVCSIPE